MVHLFRYLLSIVSCCPSKRFLVHLWPPFSISFFCFGTTSSLASLWGSVWMKALLVLFLRRSDSWQTPAPKCELDVEWTKVFVFFCVGGVSCVGKPLHLGEKSSTCCINMMDYLLLSRSELYIKPEKHFACYERATSEGFWAYGLHCHRIFLFQLLLYWLQNVTSTTLVEILAIKFSEI